MRYDARDSRRTLSIALATTVVGVCACASLGTTGGPCQPTAALRWAAEPWANAGERRPVRVWLDGAEGEADGWGARGIKRLRNAIESWNELSLPVKLVLAQSPRSADVTVDIIRSFPPDNTLGENEFRVGLTKLVFDDAGRIMRASVSIAKATSSGIRYAIIDQEAALLHELGHALGLPHLSNQLALMSNQVRVTSLTAADVGLARSVYRGIGCPRTQLAARRPNDR